MRAKGPVFSLEKMGQQIPADVVKEMVIGGKYVIGVEVTATGMAAKEL